MLTKDLVINQEYAFCPKVLGRSYFPWADWFRVRLITIDAEDLVEGNRILVANGRKPSKRMMRHIVIHLDDITGYPLAHSNNELRAYWVTSAELMSPWAMRNEWHKRKETGQS